MSTQHIWEFVPLLHSLNKFVALVAGDNSVLQVQNAGNKLGRRCDMCSNYEKQLQGIQIQEAETRDQVGFLFYL